MTCKEHHHATIVDPFRMECAVQCIELLFMHCCPCRFENTNASTRIIGSLDDQLAQAAHRYVDGIEMQIILSRSVYTRAASLKAAELRCAHLREQVWS